MDPASIVGLVEFGLSCASAVSRVAASIHGGAADARKLITAIERTVLVVKELDRVVDENRRTRGFDANGLRLVRASRAECEDVLERLRLLLLRSGATVRADAAAAAVPLGAGQFYKLRAADIERSVFRKVDWARHKSGFEAVTRDLEAVNNSVVIALQVYSIRVAHRDEEKKKGLRELVGLLQLFADTGTAVEDIVPEEEDPSDVDEASRSSSSAMGSDVDVMAANSGGSPEASSPSSASRRESFSTSSATTSNQQNTSPENSSTKSGKFEHLGDSPLWHRLLRNQLEQNSRRPKLQSSVRKKRDAQIPHLLRDEESQDGVATTRSFLLSKNGLEEWTSCEWEYPLQELAKRLHRKHAAQEAMRTFQALPQPCKDLITHLCQHDTADDFFWTASLLDPVPSRRKSWVSRFLRKESGQASDVSGVLAVLKRCRRIVDPHRELTRTLEDFSTYVSQSVQLKIENEVLRSTARLQGGVDQRARKRASKEIIQDEQSSLQSEGQHEQLGSDVLKALQEAKATVEELAAMKEAAEEERRSGQDDQLLEIRESITALRDEQIAREEAMKAQRAAERTEEAAEKQKAAEDAAKLLEAAKRAREEAETRAEEDAKAKKADPAAAPKAEEKKQPIAFKDAVGRKFMFPWHISCTWKGMEELINHAFSHVDVLGPLVRDGFYDLVGPSGEIILPQIWDALVQPGWQVTMDMWPIENPEPPPQPPQMPPPMPPPPPAFPMEDWMCPMPRPSGSRKTKKSARHGPGKVDKLLGRERSAEKPKSKPKPKQKPKQKPKPKQKSPAPSIRHGEEPLAEGEFLSPAEELAKRALMVYTGTGELFSGPGVGAVRDSLSSSSSEPSEA